ncbi:MAG: HesA/MoeB/ThiF family protein [Verrucomicrobiota bacterium]
MSYLERIASAYSEEKLSQQELAYYARHLLLPGIGTKGQLKLKSARVLVVGAGGLGCPALLALAGAGVGHLTVIDGDTVAMSNLSRQWLHQYAEAGINKAISASETLRSMNPFITIEPREEMLSQENVNEWITQHDIVVDATDDLGARYLIDDSCAELGKPWVHAALYRERSQLCVFWAKYGARFSQLFPEKSEAPSCAGAGMMGATAGAVANLQALEVIKLITASAPPKVGELVSFDAEGIALQNFRMPEVQKVEPLPEDKASLSYSIDTDTLRQAQSISQPLALIDIRSANEFNKGSMNGALHQTAESILESGLEVGAANNSRVILLCEEGLVSAMLVDALRARGMENVFYLEGGILALVKARNSCCN